MAITRSITVALAVTTQQIFGPNPRRVSVTLSPPIAGRSSFGFGEDAILDRGLTLHAGNNPVQLIKGQCAQDIERSIHIIHSAGGESNGFVEESNP